jgi:4a-hydroxytetrahydrobiopterin dehydratase
MKNEEPTVCDLANKSCKPCEGGTSPMGEGEIMESLKKLQGWEFINGRIHKTYSFKDYYQTMAFVNVVAWVAHKENHHPDLEVSYNKCKVFFSTHAINGVSENDFICAAKIDAFIAVRLTF